jgi:DNA invertase Pin-like site-specific DNA recombinase
MTRAAFYVRVSSTDQHPETQLLDLQQLASQRGFEVVEVFTDHGVSGVRTKRPALDRLLADARRGRFQVLAVWSCDRLARSTRHFLNLLDELNHLGVQFISLRESVDTSGVLGRALLTLIAVVGELEHSLIVERVRAGMRRAKLEGRRLGRRPLELDREAILRDRARGLSLGQLAKLHHASRTTIRRALAAVPKGSLHTPSQSNENRRPITAA